MPSPPEPVKIEMSPQPTDAAVLAVQKTVPENPLYRVALAVAPWGEIYVNGKKVGVSPPMTELKLAPGKYSVEIRNSTFDAYREDIDVRNGSNVKIKHRFQ